MIDYYCYSAWMKERREKVLKWTDQRLNWVLCLIQTVESVVVMVIILFLKICFDDFFPKK